MRHANANVTETQEAVEKSLEIAVIIS